MRGGIPGPLHPRTREAFNEVARRGGKAILLVNRRGWSTHLTCRSCGHAWECPDCDVSLVLHRDGGLRAITAATPSRSLESCPECSSVTIARVGSGTQRVEAELMEMLAPLEIFRLDSDSAASGGHARGPRPLRVGPNPGVLVGTQMVAKGHDFPDVTLSVILDADGALRLPDFRSEERTFALITQLAGRSGRGEAGGRVLVQALATGAPSIRHAAQHDSAGFLAQELERRQRPALPAVLTPDRDRARGHRRGAGRGLRRDRARPGRRSDLGRRRAARPGAAVPAPRQASPPPADQVGAPARDA